MVANAPLIKECRRGESEAQEELIIRYWPFINAIPDMVDDLQARVILVEPFRNFSIDIFKVVWIAKKTLDETRKNGTRRQKLWHATAVALGIGDEEID